MPPDLAVRVGQDELVRIPRLDEVIDGMAHVPGLRANLYRTMKELGRWLLQDPIGRLVDTIPDEVGDPLAILEALRENARLNHRCRERTLTARIEAIRRMRERRREW